MAGDRFSRFQNLERERPLEVDAGGGEPSNEPSGGRAESGRFNALQTEVRPAPGPTPIAQGHLARFDAPKQAELSLDASTEQDQPFIRCRVCEGDNNRFAVECQHCNADLNTPEQRAFNEQLWAQLREARQHEAEAHQQMQAAQLQAEFELKQAQRKAYEQLARRVAVQTEAWLEGRPLVDFVDPDVATGRIERIVLLVGVAVCVVLIAVLLSHGANYFTRRLVWVLVLAILGMGVRLARGFGIR